jgi:hypothetical protein
LFLQLYSLFFATAAGKLLTEEFSISVKRTAAAQPVNTVAKGFAGMSPGAPMLTADISNAVPAGNFEFEMGRVIAGLQIIELQILGPGGLAIAVNGFVPEDSFKHSVGQMSQYDFTFMAPIAQFQ